MDNTELIGKIKKLDLLQDEINILRPLDPAVEKRIIDKLRLNWNYNSNAIEGNSLTLGETEQLLSHGLTAKGKPLKDHLDIEGHNSVIEILADVVRQQEPITEFLIRSLHSVMLGGTRETSQKDSNGIPQVRTIHAGRYKSEANHVLTETGVVRSFASPIDTPFLMEELISWYKKGIDDQAFHPVLFASSFHHRFVSIHPFDDGNGRMARILMNVILMQKGYLPAVLLLSERNSYIGALAQADANEFDALYEVIVDACIRSAEIYLQGAKGGPIDELGDFDQQLALISQSVLGAQNKEFPAFNKIERADVFETLILPLYSSIGYRLSSHLNGIFSNVNLKYIAKFSEDGLAVGNTAEEYKKKSLVLLSSKNLEETTFFYNGTGYIKNSSKNFLVNITFFLAARQITATMQGTNFMEAEIFKSDLKSHFSSTETEETIKKFLTLIVQCAANFIKT